MIFNVLFRRWYYEKNDWIVSDEIEDDEQGKLTYLFFKYSTIILMEDLLER
jgi:hypothetical protein